MNLMILWIRNMSYLNRLNSRTISRFMGLLASPVMPVGETNRSRLWRSLCLFMLLLLAEAGFALCIDCYGYWDTRLARDPFGGGKLNAPAPLSHGSF